MPQRRQRDSRHSAVKWPAILAGGAAAGIAATDSCASVVYTPLNDLLDAKGTTGYSIAIPSIGASDDGQVGLYVKVDSQNGILTEKASTTLTGAATQYQYAPNVMTSGFNVSYQAFNSAGSQPLSAGTITAFNPQSLIYSYQPNAEVSLVQLLINPTGTNGSFTDAAGLKYVGFTYSSSSTNQAVTSHAGWLAFQTLSTYADPSNDLTGMISGIAVESVANLPIAAGSTTSTPIITFTGLAGNGAWDAGSTANWQTSTGLATTYSEQEAVTFNDANNIGGQYNITLNASNSTINPGSITPALVTVSTANTYNFNGAGISGFTELVKSGSGSLVLTNPNTYSGATILSQGSLTVTATGSLANSPVVVGTAGGTSGSFTLQATATNGIFLRSLGGLTVLNGSAVVSASNASSNRSVVVTPALTIATAGKLDLNDNDLIYQTGSSYALSKSLPLIEGYLESGYNSGKWNGTTGIVSTTASSNSTHLTALGMMINDTGANSGNSTGTPIYPNFDGEASTDTDILVKYTYYGDANLDGVVDGSDYSLIDNGYLNHLTGWFNGDFNYDGVIDGSDYTLIDNAFNQQGAAFNSIIANQTSQIGAPSESTAVPEPTSLGLLAMGATGLLAYRRRSTRSA
jgi:autotransporter-associated beta strand protein